MTTFVKGDGLPCWKCGASSYSDCSHRPAERARPAWMSGPAQSRANNNNPTGWRGRRNHA